MLYISRTAEDDAQINPFIPFLSISLYFIFVTIVSQERLKGSWSLDAER
jgi:hypothetical protein